MVIDFFFIIVVVQCWCNHKQFSTHTEPGQAGEIRLQHSSSSQLKYDNTSWTDPLKILREKLSAELMSCCPILMHKAQRVWV